MNKQVDPVVSGSQFCNCKIKLLPKGTRLFSVHVTKLILYLIPLFAGMITAAETPLPVSQISLLHQKSRHLIYPLENKFQSPISTVSSVNRELH